MAALVLLAPIVALGWTTASDAAPTTDLDTGCFIAPTPACLYKVAIAAAREATSEKRRENILSEIAQSAAWVGETDVAGDAAEILPEGEPRDRALEALAAALARAGRFDKALAIPPRIATKLVRDVAYRGIAVAQAKAYDVYGGPYAVTVARQTAALIDGDQIRAQALAGIDAIPPYPPGWDVLTVRELRPGEADAQLLVLRNKGGALEAARGLSDPTVKDEALALIAAGRAEAQDFDTALRIAGEIEAIPSCPEDCDTRRDLAIAEVLRIEAMIGDRATALATADALADTAREAALAAIVHGTVHAWVYLPTEAVGTATSLRRPELRAAAFKDIAGALSERIVECGRWASGLHRGPNPPKCPSHEGG